MTLLLSNPATGGHPAGHRRRRCEHRQIDLAGRLVRRAGTERLGERSATGSGSGSERKTATPARRAASATDVPITAIVRIIARHPPRTDRQK
ncbi:hypothetical protein [Actinoplanes regularis]|uniref:hypothetical protein n=1 Tax=Actinoplanes regularis TaxID=52697 RepID=UPI002554E18F|nr:hypothetical protein [Actinoplanes regularis]